MQPVDPRATRPSPRAAHDDPGGTGDRGGVSEEGRQALVSARLSRDPNKPLVGPISLLNRNGSKDPQAQEEVSPFPLGSQARHLYVPSPFLPPQASPVLAWERACRPHGANAKLAEPKARQKTQGKATVSE